MSIKSLPKLCAEKLPHLIRIRASKDFWHFNDWFFEGVPTPSFHREIVSIFESPEKHAAIAAPRSHAKTTVCSIRHNLWSLLHCKEPFILQVSDTYTQAIQVIAAIRYILETNSKIIQIYKPRVIREREDDLIIESFAGRARITARGTGQSLRGTLDVTESRPTLILCDDLDEDERVKNPDLRRADWEWFWQVLIPALSPTGRIRVIGTILHKESILARLLKQDGWNAVIYKAIQDDGKALWEDYYSLEKLLAHEEQCRKAGLLHKFYCEFQNNPVDPEGQEFQRNWITYREVKPDELKDLIVTTTADLAISKKDSACYTAIVTMAWDKEGKGNVLDVRRGRWGVYETINELFDVKSKFRPYRMGIEAQAYQQALVEVFRRENQLRNEHIVVTELRARNSKEERIRALFGLFARGQIEFSKSFPELEEELTTFPYGVTDDICDSLAFQLQFMSIAPSTLVGRENSKSDGAWLLDYVEKGERGRYHKDFNDYLGNY